MPPTTVSARPLPRDISDTEAVQSYLSDAYRLYIPKMLDIGLGATTLSFTKFHRAFHVNEAQGVDFAERLEASYALLKNDWMSPAVDTRIPVNRPASMSACEQLNERYFVCTMPAPAGSTSQRISDCRFFRRCRRHPPEGSVADAVNHNHRDVRTDTRPARCPYSASISRVSQVKSAIARFQRYLFL